MSTDWVVPRMLRWARERLGLTPKQAAEASQKLRGFTAISAEQITAWETGKENPDYEHLETLTEVYACPIYWFFAENPPEEIEVVRRISCRGLQREQNQLSAEVRQALAWLMEVAEWVSGLISTTLGIKVNQLQDFLQHTQSRFLRSVK